MAEALQELTIRVNQNSGDIHHPDTGSPGFRVCTYERFSRSEDGAPFLPAVDA
jgi:hypothetical protein